MILFTTLDSIQYCRYSFPGQYSREIQYYSISTPSSIALFVVKSTVEYRYQQSTLLLALPGIQLLVLYQVVRSCTVCHMTML